MAGFDLTTEDAPGTIPVLPTKSEWPTSIAAYDFSLFRESLQNRIEKCQRIFYPSEIVSPVS